MVLSQDGQNIYKCLTEIIGTFINLFMIAIYGSTGKEKQSDPLQYFCIEFKVALPICLIV